MKGSCNWSIAQIAQTQFK